MNKKPSIEAVALFTTMRRLGLSLSSAESCTGGMASAAITDIAGASSFYNGGLIAYSNTIKEKMLGVPADILVRHGAVSKETALAMASGAALAFESDCAFAITGIAGPDGATEDKPLGTVWFAYAIAGTTLAERRCFTGERSAVREAATAHALSRMSVLAEEYSKQ